MTAGHDAGFRGVELGAFLDSLASGEPAPASGTAAALAGAVAASLVVKVARTAPDWEDAAGVAAQALALRDRLARLGDEVAVAYAAVLSTFDAEETDATKQAARDARLGRDLARAAELPLAIAAAASDAAELASLAAEHALQRHHADAAAAAALAEGAARAAALLVEANLASTPGDRRVDEAAAYAASAGRSARAAAGES